VTLYHGNCLDILTWLDADVLVTDPPYGVRYSGVTRPAEIVGDEDFSAAEAAIEMAGAARMPMAVFANHASLGNTLSAVTTSHQRTRVAVWHKTNINGATPGNPWLADVEFVVCGVPSWPGIAASGYLPARRFTGNPAWNSSPDAYLHPTQKNVRVMELVLELMPPGTVADPFAGSGSTLVAARNQGRQAIGVEIEERYCEVIAKRLAQGVLL
jgi:hypothetical protein